MPDYQALNRANWDERAPVHAASADYGFERFVEDPAHLSDVVRFDLPRLPSLDGLRGVHLQCHIGTDTLSLARLGARMSGLDFSDSSLAEARSLAERAGADIEYVRSDVYDAAEALGREGFDFVFTGVGALCWLPDIERWARTVASLLRPGGRLFIRESHPILWSLADPVPGDDRIVVEYAYFEIDEPLLWTDDATYVESDVVLKNSQTASWNHGLGEIITALMSAGMELALFTEHDSVPWNALPGLMEEAGGGEWRLADRPWRLPHTYTLHAVKRA